ncbi:MAG TPA: hypothetical protein VM238_00055 [Phycisphaerae bacterium]|nr:hypothetical protein [Phycisphaerae bacterium]
MPKSSPDGVLGDGRGFSRESFSGEGMWRSRAWAPDTGLLFFDRRHWRGALQHVCDGGIALVGWFDSGSAERPEVGRRWREMRLFGFDRTAILRAAKGFGVRLPEIAEGLGVGVPFVRMWGGPVGRALRACGLGQGGAA